MCNVLGCYFFLFVVRWVVNQRASPLFGVGLLVGDLRGVVPVDSGNQGGGCFEVREVGKEDPCGGQARDTVQWMVMCYIE